jgi:hypothetical protein
MILRSPAGNENTITLNGHTCHVERQRSVCFSNGEKADASAEFIPETGEGPQNDIVSEGRFFKSSQSAV